MATLETQYRNYKERNPLSDFTFEQWQVWNANMLANALEKYRKGNEVSKDLYEVIPISNDEDKFEFIDTSTSIKKS